ncbi:MAG: arylesterase [Legionellaceae bacterium]|nr:arylesterase [Legionellaceae bacterium]HCA89723.1 arylesterase [Legionellales bacterium]|tara:strand:+ start:175 stop:804 length:630 start_codon:yes stop_codon:yes gene_type:complete
MGHKLLVIILLSVLMMPSYAKTILIIGDSLSAAYGLMHTDLGWVALLQKRLVNQRLPYQVVNASVSGATTSNGINQLLVSLKSVHPDIIIIELGANDGLRGLPLMNMQKNLERMILVAQQKNARVLLLATLLPPNYGAHYLTQFNQIYQTLAAQYKVALVPMFLDKVAGHTNLMQTDGLHPNAKAQTQILNNVWPALLMLIKAQDIQVD